jgi:hypothetical protein|tara:strand:- start:49 stop:186 length:138 start_codon:yes stop_codon:yes gene_type:complete
MQNHNYSLEDVENMMPWEREIYLSMLIDQIKKQNEDAERQRMNNG